MGEVRAEGLLRAIDPVVRDGLSAEQEAAIRNAARQDTRKSHPVGIRLSLPSPFGRLYLTLVAGRARRSAARLVVERARHPLSGLANLIAIAVLGATVVPAGVAIFLARLRRPYSVTPKAFALARLIPVPASLRLPGRCRLARTRAPPAAGPSPIGAPRPAPVIAA